MIIIVVAAATAVVAAATAVVAAATDGYRGAAIFVSGYRLVWFLCSMTYQTSWVILCQSYHCRRSIVVQFNPYLQGRIREFKTFPGAES